MHVITRVSFTLWQLITDPSPPSPKIKIIFKIRDLQLYMKFKSQPIFEWLIERAREDPGLTRIQQGHNQRLILSCPGIKHWSFHQLTALPLSHPITKKKIVLNI